MKIAMLLDQVICPQVISERTAGQLAELGDLSWNETRENELENAKWVLKGADIAVTSWGSPRMTAELLDVAPNLKLIVHAAGSVKSIVTDEMYDRGIRIVSSARVLSEGVSETALGMTIACAKNLFALNQETHAGGWSHTGITEMYELTIGIVGFGMAGRHYAELLQPFLVDVIAYDPGVTAQEMAALGVRKVELAEVFSESDIVSLHAPELESTWHIVNEKSLSTMKDGAILINTARGSLVDEDALANALRTGKLKCACLDVTSPEPPALDSPLRSLDNCILTPHLAGQANNGLRKLGYHCLWEIRHFLDGEPLNGEVTRDMLGTIA
ncbi:MAG: hydroxyacid dehydrogenase [Lachnospiraceae bacterium]|nr:hydroxyacid dehydrogenase [Lachnospiraceae bacterium]